MRMAVRPASVGQTCNQAVGARGYLPRFANQTILVRGCDPAELIGASTHMGSSGVFQSDNPAHNRDQDLRHRRCGTVAVALRKP